MTTQNPQSAPARRGVAASRGSGPFTGWHMLAICVAFFGVVIAVNVVMADLAISTFSGEVVENSYVASQRFNGWLDEAKAEAEMLTVEIIERARAEARAIAPEGVDRSAADAADEG